MQQMINWSKSMDLRYTIKHVKNSPTKPDCFSVFWRISQSHELGLIYHLPCWNHVAKRFCCINTYLKTIFFGSFEGSQDHWQIKLNFRNLLFISKWSWHPPIKLKNIRIFWIGLRRSWFGGWLFCHYLLEHGKPS